MAKLTKRQKDVIEYLVTHPEMTQKEITEKVGLAPDFISKIKHKQHFQQALEERRKEVWADAVLIAQDRMIQMAENGNFKACEYILNSSGYKAPEKLEVENKIIKVELTDDTTTD